MLVESFQFVLVATISEVKQFDTVSVERMTSLCAACVVLALLIFGWVVVLVVTIKKRPAKVSYRDNSIRRMKAQCLRGTTDCSKTSS